MMKLYNQHSARERKKVPFEFGTRETAKANRSIPISQLYAKFIRGENIANYAMSKVSYNPLPDNPFKKKGFDQADIPDIKAQIKDIIDTSQQMLKEEQEEKALASLEVNDKEPDATTN